MLKYAQTTTLILLWCFVLSLVWSAALYARLAWRKPAPARSDVAGAAILPALVVGPLLLVLGFRVIHVNLLFPVHFFADFETLAVAALVPALVLVLASGLAGTLRRGIATEYAHWAGKPFATVALAIGRSPHSALRRLVLAKALAGGWSQCLPWLFGELVIVETVFNAPGLGLDAWHLAKQRDLSGLATTVGWLAAMYIVCVAMTAALNAWLGKRLESYA